MLTMAMNSTLWNCIVATIAPPKDYVPIFALNIWYNAAKDKMYLYLVDDWVYVDIWGPIGEINRMRYLNYLKEAHAIAEIMGYRESKSKAKTIRCLPGNRNQ